MRSKPPAGALKFVRVVSMRAEVQPPEAFRIGVMRRLPPPSRLTLAGLWYSLYQQVPVGGQTG